MKRIRISSAISLNNNGRIGLWMIGAGAVAYVLSTLLLPGVIEGAARSYMMKVEQLRALSFIAAVSPAIVVGGFALVLIGRDYTHDVDILDVQQQASTSTPPQPVPPTEKGHAMTDWERIKSGASRGFGPGIQKPES